MGSWGPAALSLLHPLESHVHSEADQLGTTEEDSRATLTKAPLCQHGTMPQALPGLPGVARNTVLTFMVQTVFIL